MKCEAEKTARDEAFEKLKANYETAKPYFGAFGSVTRGIGLAAAACFVAGFTFGRGRLKPHGYDPRDAPLPGSSRWLPQPPPPLGYVEPPVTSHDVVNAPNLGCIVAIGNSIKTNEEAKKAWRDFYDQLDKFNDKNAAYNGCMNNHKNITEENSDSGDDTGSGGSGDTGGDGSDSGADSGLPEFE